MQYTITTKHLPEAEELRCLFLQTSWAKDRSLEGVKLLLQNTAIFVVVRARSNRELIGFGRALSDGVYRALLDDIIISENFRKNGLGTKIVTELLWQLEDVEQIFLNTKPHLEGFYQQFSFAKAKTIAMKL